MQQCFIILLTAAFLNLTSVCCKKCICSNGRWALLPLLPEMKSKEIMEPQRAIRFIKTRGLYYFGTAEYILCASSLLPPGKYVSDQTCMNLLTGLCCPVQHPEILWSVNGQNQGTKIEH